MPLFDKADRCTVSTRDAQGNVAIGWADGRATIHRGVPKEPSCRRCDASLYASEYVNGDGFCRPCYAEVAFDVPGRLQIPTNLQECGDLEYIWARSVERTLDTSFYYRSLLLGADIEGNNFGVGDTVHYDATRDDARVLLVSGEGVVVALHEYHLYNDRSQKSFLAKVFLVVLVQGLLLLDV